MSLDYVKKGEPVRSSTVNSIIDAVAGGGNQSPDFIVTGTRGGPQIVMPSQVGYTQLTSQTIFDVKNYILSGWPMAQVQLGFSVDDALEAVNYIDPNGKKNATSAVVIFKNSENCPIGGSTLSGYILGDDDWPDSKYGNTGWVKTKMEGVFGKTYPRLQVWKTNDNIYEVLANVENDEDTKRQLSSVLQQGGADASDLSTIKIIRDWKLLYQTEIESGEGESSYKTSRTQMKHGVVDIYEYSDEEEKKNQWRAMLKAFLGCYDVTDSDENKKSYWTWLIPLGDDATYNSNIEGAWTSQLTYGGDPIVIKSDEGSLDDSFKGKATFVEDSDFGGNFIAFGKFIANGNETIEPGLLSIELSYDSENHAVVGELKDGNGGDGQNNEGEQNQQENNEGSEGEGEQDDGNAVLGTSILIAKCDSYEVGDDVEVLDEVHPRHIFSGTVGDFFDGTPKLDSYTPMDSTSQFKSLEWTTRGDVSAESSSDDVTCRCMQLYNFDKDDTVSADVDKDQFVVRRYDNESNSASVVYFPISSFTASAASSPDADVQAAGLSSIQTRELSGDGTKVLELYKFNDPAKETVYLSAQENYEFIIRDNVNHCIKYANLSGLSGGGEGGKGGLPGPFEMEINGNTATFTNCVMRVARAYFFYQDQTCTVPRSQDSIVYVILRHSDSPSIQVSCGDYATVTQNLGTDWSNMLSTTVTPLYRTLSGEVKCDYRYMMNVQAYDSRNYSYSTL